MKRREPGRNQPCFCGSGRKYKHCHGRVNRSTDPAREPDITSTRSPMHSALQQHQQRERVRIAQQGHGKPIISSDFAGQRFVAVGNKLYWSRIEETQTFIDFLMNYIKDVLGSEWGNAELTKSPETQHPVLRWYRLVVQQQQEGAKAVEKARLFRTPVTGAIGAYTNLAYNLYLLKHNAELQQHLIQRIKNPDSFFGGYYETYVAAWFILAGFKLELEDERDASTSHCEFTATSPTGSKYSVEAKARQPGKKNLAIGNQLQKALKKRALHKRVVFIEMNVPMSTDFSLDSFMRPIADRVRSKENMLIDGAPTDEAYVVVTNLPHHLHLDELDPIPNVALGLGYKIPDFGHVSFPSLIDAYRAHQKHADIRRVMDAAYGYRIPTTFSGELPEFTLGDAQRLQIGAEYQFDDGTVGKLTQGLVIEESKELIMVVQSGDDSLMYRGKLTDDELSAYRRHPETFFGGDDDRHVPKQAETPFDLFLFFLNGYRETTREQLLEFMREHSDQEFLRRQSTEDLRLIYCERVTLSATSQHKNKP